LDYHSGGRVVFGRSDAPPAGLSEAVMASCAIPGWFAPVPIGGRRYVDGGMWSATNADVVAGLGLDEVYVLAPMVSRQMGRPRSMAARLERRLRRVMSRQLIQEARLIRQEGTRVVLLGPGPEDLAVIGVNLMNSSRRAQVVATSVRTSAAELRRCGVGERDVPPDLASAG
jgi:NTE family protein